MTKNQKQWNQINKNSEDIKELYKQNNNSRMKMKDYMTLIISIVSFFITLFNFVLFYSNYSVNIVPIMDLENERPYFSLYNEGNRKINSMDTNLDINIDIAYTIYDKKEYEEKGEKQIRNQGEMLLFLLKMSLFIKLNLEKQ